MSETISQRADNLLDELSNQLAKLPKLNPLCSQCEARPPYEIDCDCPLHICKICAMNHKCPSNKHDLARVKFESEVLKQEIKQERNLVQEMHQREIDELNAKHIAEMDKLRAIYEAQTVMMREKLDQLQEQYEFNISSLENEKSEITDEAKTATQDREALRQQLEELRLEFEAINQKNEQAKVEKKPQQARKSLVARQGKTKPKV